MDNHKGINMLFLTNNIQLGFMIGLLVILSFFSKSTYALSCTQNGNIRQDIVLDKPIKVSMANLKPGTLLWRSQTYTSTFQCDDDWKYPEGEDTYLYWDPETRIGKIHNSIEVGVTYNGIDIKPVKGLKQYVGPGTECNRNSRGKCQPPAKSLAVTVSYAVYIKATGNQPPLGGKIEDNGSYSLFHVDGLLGLNSTPKINFNTYISGLGNIHFISCKPIIHVMAQNGSSINFGTMTQLKAESGKIEKQVPFSIVANISAYEDRQNCQDETLQVSFSSASHLKDGHLILPSIDSGFGIFISQAKKPETPIMMNTPVELGFINNTYVEKNFIANFKWLNNTPKIGSFTASANIDVTFR